MASIYKRGTVWWGRAAIAGNERRCSLRTTDAKVARQRLAAWVERLQAERWGDTRRTWREAVARYLSEQAPDLRPQTARRYATSLAGIERLVVRRRGGTPKLFVDLHLDEIDRAALEAVARRPGVSNATRRRDLTAVSVVLRAAWAWDWIGALPSFDPIRRVTRERREPRPYIPDADLDRFMATLPDPLRRLVWMLDRTGARLEEAAVMTRADVDHRRAAVRLHGTKTGTGRWVQMTPADMAEIRSWPARLDTAYLFAPPGSDAPYRSLSSQLRTCRRRLGLTWTTHDIRHRHAIDYLRERRGSLYQLQVRLGHRSITMTERYLEHLTEDEAKAVKEMAG